jgi:hypothetical protein
MRVKIVEYGTMDSHYKQKGWPLGREVVMYKETVRAGSEGFIRFQSPEGFFAAVKIEVVNNG